MSLAVAEFTTFDLDAGGYDWWSAGSTFVVVTGGSGWVKGEEAPWLVVLSVWRSDGTRRKYCVPYVK